MSVRWTRETQGARVGPVASGMVCQVGPTRICHCTSVWRASRSSGSGSNRPRGRAVSASSEVTVVPGTSQEARLGMALATVTVLDSS